jgi:hypothetical protein
MRFLLICWLLIFAIQANSQFVSEVYNAQKTVTKAERVGRNLYDDLLKHEWQIGFDDITIFPEELKIPYIEMGIYHIDSTKKSEEYYEFRKDIEFSHMMYMFDRANEEEVRKFFTDVVIDEEDQMVFFETKTGIVVLAYNTEKNSKNERKEIENLIELLKKLFTKYYEDL